jgi:hypothetical protein
LPEKEISESYPVSKWSSEILPILKEGYSFKIPFSGLSMYPFIAGERDEAVIACALGKRLKRGDIVLYVRDDGFHVLHRIHHIKDGSYYMIGDAQTVIEGPIKAESILAVATAIVRKNKTISCDRLDYRVLSGIWLLLRPFRPLIFRAVSKLRGILKI